MEVLVHQFNFGDLTIEELDAIHQTIQNNFPEMKVISLPNTFSLGVYDLQDLKNLGNYILDFVEKVENNG